MKYDNLDTSKVNEIQKKVESYSETIDDIVNKIVRPYCRDLDKYCGFIRDCLSDDKRQPTDQELEDFCLNLSTFIYWASAGCEQLGIRDDISNAIYKEIYNTERQEVNGGTVADKNSVAELNSQQELLTNICYNRAFKIMKSKVENAQELLSSCKKVLTRRIAGYGLTQQGV